MAPMTIHQGGASDIAYRTQSQLRELWTKRDLEQLAVRSLADQCPKESSVRRRNITLTRGYPLEGGWPVRLRRNAAEPLRD